MSVLIVFSGSFVSIASVNLPFINIRAMSFVGLIALMIGTGCVKTNQNVFGGNQFKLPEQAHLLDYYFSMHYLMMKCGQVIGMVLVPILREDVKCFGSDDCYPLAFGVPTFTMLIALAILLLGKKSFVHVQPAGGSVLLNVLKCIKVGMNVCGK